MKRGRGMKGLVDKSRGMETLINESLTKIKPTDPFRESKRITKKTKLIRFRYFCGQRTSLFLPVFFKEKSG